MFRVGKSNEEIQQINPACFSRLEGLDMLPDDKESFGLGLVLLALTKNERLWLKTSVGSTLV